jgi:hypothetical protein
MHRGVEGQRAVEEQGGVDPKHLLHKLPDRGSARDCLMGTSVAYRR